MRKTISAYCKLSVASSIAVSVIMLLSVTARADQPPGVYTVKEGTRSMTRRWKAGRRGGQWPASAAMARNRKDSWVGTREFPEGTVQR